MEMSSLARSLAVHSLAALFFALRLIGLVLSLRGKDYLPRRESESA